jgi:acetylxylan esterase
MLAASAVSMPDLDPAIAAEHQFEKRYTDAQIHNTTTTTSCSDVHLIIDRATGEPPSQGVIGTLATEITSRIPGTTVEWVNYPAVLIPYDSSTNSGIEMTKAAIKSYADKCTKAKIVLLGYSQGAQVVGDTLCGGGGAIGLGPWTDPLEESYLQRITAVVQMGDPRFMPNTGWDFGTAITGGVSIPRDLYRRYLNNTLQLFPRQANQTCDRIAAITRSYCDLNDPFCSLPGLDYNVHATYDIRYNDNAFEFVRGKVKYVAVYQFFVCE